MATTQSERAEPASVLVRLASTADAGGIARVHVQSSEEAYAPLAKSWVAMGVEQRRAQWLEWLGAWQAAPRGGASQGSSLQGDSLQGDSLQGGGAGQGGEALHGSGAPPLVWVAEVDGEVVGFINGGPARERAHGAELEMYVLHVLPERRGMGIGRLLWREACQRLRGAELRSLCVSTLAELRCCSFYDRRGGAVLSRRQRLFYGAERTEVIYFWGAGQPCS